MIITLAEVVLNITLSFVVYLIVTLAAGVTLGQGVGLSILVTFISFVRMIVIRRLFVRLEKAIKEHEL